MERKIKVTPLKYALLASWQGVSRCISLCCELGHELCVEYDAQFVLRQMEKHWDDVKAAMQRSQKTCDNSKTLKGILRDI